MAQNYCLWSEVFGNAVWTQVGGSNLVENSAIAPDGTTTADTVKEAGTGNNFFLQQVTASLPALSAITWSFYAKLTGVNMGDKTITMAIGRADATPFEGATSTQTLTTEWKRYAMTYIFPSAHTAYNLSVAKRASGAAEAYFWGAQMGVTDTLNVYVRTEGSPIVQIENPATNILTLRAGSDLSTWTAADGASKGTSDITFPQEASGNPGKVTYTFLKNLILPNTCHRFTGFVIPTDLNYEHTDIKCFVKNERTGERRDCILTFDNHSDKGGQSEIGESKPFNVTFYASNQSDQFTVGFENFANNQPGCTFAVSGLGVFIVK